MLYPILTHTIKHSTYFNAIHAISWWSINLSKEGWDFEGWDKSFQTVDQIYVWRATELSKKIPLAYIFFTKVAYIEKEKAK